jgi:hypothetical protein
LKQAHKDQLFFFLLAVAAGAILLNVGNINQFFVDREREAETTTRTTYQWTQKPK